MELLKKFTPTKPGISTELDKIKQNIEQGALYASEAKVLAKTLKELSAGLDKMVQPYLERQQAEQAGKDAMQAYGATVKHQERNTYDFSNSPAWVELRGNIAEYERIIEIMYADLKRIEQIAKTTSKKIETLNEDTGEVEVINPALVKSSRSVFTVHLPKE